MNSPGPPQIRVGTSAFTARGWAGTFYPEGLKSKDYLSYYSRHFDCVEVDSTFYGAPRPAVTRNWRERTPAGFLFTAKVPRIVTHDRCLVGVDAEMNEFLSSMELLQEKLGPMLLQFPYFGRDVFEGVDAFLTRLEGFLKTLPEGFRFAVEIRNREWLGKSLTDLLGEHEVALALADHSLMPPVTEVFQRVDPITAGFTYIRWLGDRKGIEALTQIWNRTIVDRRRDLELWVQACRTISERGQTILGFANNHYGGYAPDTVRLFRELWDYRSSLTQEAEGSQVFPMSSESRFVPLKGRGASSNPRNRFERLEYELDREVDGGELPAPTTRFFRDSSRSALAYNDSPDVGFDVSLNPYRGCEHGCVYCYARPTHEYLGFSAGLDFESMIMVKEDAPALLRSELSSPSWKPRVVALSGVTDPYQPIERKLKLTRACIEVMVEFMNPLVVVTKNRLVARDKDLLAELAGRNAAAVCVSVTTLDPELAAIMEPRTSTPAARLEAIRELSSAGVPTGVMVAPVIPGINDQEIPAIVRAAADAGARTANYVIVRLPYAVEELFETWLTQHFPDRKNKVLNRLRSLRGGRLNDSRFGVRMRGEGVFSDEIKFLFQASCKKTGIDAGRLSLSTDSFRRPEGPQLSLFS